MIFSRRVTRRDLYCIVAAPVIIAGSSGMLRLRGGRFDWTVQVGYPPPLTESGARRRAQEKAVRLTMGSLHKNMAEEKQRSSPILGLDLNSKSRVRENTTERNKKLQDTRWKACCGTQAVPRSQQCTQNLDLRTSRHKALRARWITVWDLWEFVTLSKTVECSGIQGADNRLSLPDCRETTCQFCCPCDTHYTLREGRQRQWIPEG